MPNGDLAKGFALGLGAAVAIPVALVAVAAGAPPIRRAIGRTGLIVTEKFREGTAEMVEVVEDLVAEVQEQRETSIRASQPVRPAKKTTATRSSPRKKTTGSSGKAA
jgi:xanthosine utilization system XapX-like protein